MSHVRTQIRAALVNLLVDANANVGANVYTGRARPLAAEKLPAIDIDFGRFGGSRADGGPIESEAGAGADPTRLLFRRPLLTIDVLVRSGADGYLDELDAIWVDVEKALAGDNTLGGLVARIAPAGEPLVTISAEGELPVVHATMPFEVEYATAFNAPESVA